MINVEISIDLLSASRDVPFKDMGDLRRREFLGGLTFLRAGSDGAYLNDRANQNGSLPAGGV
jgi:hypothetical protein